MPTPSTAITAAAGSLCGRSPRLRAAWTRRCASEKATEVTRAPSARDGTGGRRGVEAVHQLRAHAGRDDARRGPSTSGCCPSGLPPAWTRRTTTGRDGDRRPLRGRFARSPAGAAALSRRCRERHDFASIFARTREAQDEARGSRLRCSGGVAFLGSLANAVRWAPTSSSPILTRRGSRSRASSIRRLRAGPSRSAGRCRSAACAQGDADTVVERKEPADSRCRARARSRSDHPAPAQSVAPIRGRVGGATGLAGRRRAVVDADDRPDDDHERC